MAAWDNPIAEIRRLEREVSRLREVVAGVEALTDAADVAATEANATPNPLTGRHSTLAGFVLTRDLRNALGGAS